MYISTELKNNNIAEYLLYMWQVEDLIRANGLDLDRIKTNIVSPYQLSETEKEALLQWYSDLIEMMRAENKQTQGHLQINQNVLIRLSDLHIQLLQSSQEPHYGAAYYQTLPFIVELRSRANGAQLPEIETCFGALYGYMLLKIKKQPISEGTQKAMLKITKFISILANYYDKDKQGVLTLD